MEESCNSSYLILPLSPSIASAMCNHRQLQCSMMLITCYCLLVSSHICLPSSAAYGSRLFLIGLSLPAQDLPLSQIFPVIDSLPASGLTPQTLWLDRFFWTSRSFVFSFTITLFCLAPYGRLRWLLITFWVLVNIVHRIVSYCMTGQWLVEVIAEHFLMVCNIGWMWKYTVGCRLVAEFRGEMGWFVQTAIIAACCCRSACRTIWRWRRGEARRPMNQVHSSFLELIVVWPY